MHGQHHAADEQYAKYSSVSDSLGNTPEENQAILDQLSALTGGSSDQVLSMLNALGLVSEPDALRGGLPLHYKCVRRPGKCCE